MRHAESLCEGGIFIAHMTDPAAINPVLLELERHTALGPTYVARLMGMAYITYAQCRSGRRPLQLYHQRHVESLLALHPEVLAKLIKEHAYGNVAHKGR
jgi:hypothetical protein